MSDWVQRCEVRFIDGHAPCAEQAEMRIGWAEVCMDHVAEMFVFMLRHWVRRNDFDGDWVLPETRRQIEAMKALAERIEGTGT